MSELDATKQEVEYSAGPVRAIRHELARVAVDSVQLAELQLQLLKEECQRNAQLLIQPAWILVSGVACGSASLMIMLHAAAWAIHDVLGWPLSLSLLIIGVAGAAVTYSALQIARSELLKADITFSRSKASFMDNIRYCAQLIKGCNNHEEPH